MEREVAGREAQRQHVPVRDADAFGARQLMSQKYYEYADGSGAVDLSELQHLLTDLLTAFHPDAGAGS